uniref:t-SNARE coiled-coil homology domain-containing protein n=1 Tax=Strigamia maritima TaxID=126957 RepID=T1IH79_STRMM
MASSYSTYHSGGSKMNSDFTKLSEQIGSSIQKISQNVTSLKRIVSQLGTGHESEKLTHELRHIQHYTNELAKDTRDRLQDLSALPMPQNSNDERMRRMQKERLTNDFSRILQTFQSMQREVKQKTKDSIQQQKRQSDNGFFSDSHPSQLIQLESPVQNQSSIQMQMEDEVQLELMREQEKAMHELETDIVTVNEIFRDLATMVHEQGEVVDSIEAQMESTSIHVTEANQQLVKARDYKFSLRRKKVCIVVCLAVFLSITESRRKMACLISVGLAVLTVIILSIWLSN